MSFNSMLYSIIPLFSFMYSPTNKLLVLFGILCVYVIFIYTVTVVNLSWLLADVDADANAEEEEEKRRLISQVLELQNTLDGSNLEFCVSVLFKNNN